MARSFMEDSFHKLRSAEDEFTLLQKFREIQDAKATGQLLESKTMEILQQYDKEIGVVLSLFRQGRESPPLCKNQPPVAGAIHWAHSLFLRIRRTIARIKALPELESTDEGRAVARRFVAASREIHQYEQGLFEAWRENVSERAMELLKAPILVASLGDEEVPTTEAVAALSRGAAVAVNFHHDLSLLIREVKCPRC